VQPLRQQQGRWQGFPAWQQQQLLRLLLQLHTPPVWALQRQQEVLLPQCQQQHQRQQGLTT
jgi:hypothetical protein